MSEAKGYFPILQDRVRSRQFNSLFLFVTSRCNSLCRTCFYFDKLNSKDDLTLEEIGRISQSAPQFRKLWLSGGEPFLREGLADIVAMFVRGNGVRNVNLPTNGMLAEKIFAAIDRMLELCPETAIDLNFSIDGLQKTHDSIRGVPNNFVRTLTTMRDAAKRYRGVKRLRRNVLTVITRENYDEVERLGVFLKEAAEIDGHYFEVVRGQAPDPSLKILTRESLAKLHSRLTPFHRHYAEGLFAHLPWGVRHAAKLYYLGNLRFHYDLHEECLESPCRSLAAQWRGMDRRRPRKEPRTGARDGGMTSFDSSGEGRRGWVLSSRYWTRNCRIAGEASTMTTFRFGAIALAMAVAVLSTPGKLQAQPSSDRIQINLPYSVTVGRNILQPGTYTINPMNIAGGDSPVLMIRGDEGTKLEAAVKVTPTLRSGPQPSTRVILYHVGNKYYFDRIWLKGGNFGYQFSAPRGPKKRVTIGE